MTPPALALAQPVRHSAPQPARYLAALFLGLALLLAQTLSAHARGAPESFADLAETISPSVVNITTATTVAAPTVEPGFPDGSPFGDLFRDFGGNGPDRRAPRSSSALGSGFVISSDGFIVTNNHVIESADEITIEFFSGEELPAEVVGADPETDIALLKVDSDQPLPFVEFGDSDAIRVGDWVMAMGNPMGQGFSVSAGIISARGRSFRNSFDDYLQTDAAINRGNSGGPLFNMDGEVIGVNTAILSPNGGSIGIGFANSAAVVTRVVDQLREFGETRRGWLGVQVQDLDEEMAEALGLPGPEGAAVVEVLGGPAEAAGLESDDVIVEFNGKTVTSTRELVREVAGTPVGSSVDVVVYRDGERQTLEVTLGRRETAETVPVSAPADEVIEQDILGLTVSQITDEMREQLGLAGVSDGLVVKDVDESAEAYEKGLRAGDVISEAGQQKVASIADLEDRIDEAREAGRKSILLLVRREGEPRFVALSLG